MQIVRMQKIEKELYRKPVLIYGAGNYASIFLTYLKITHDYERIEGIIVSRKTSEDQMLLNFIVRNLDEVDELNKCNIIVAVSERTVQPIYQKLEHAGVSVCYQVTNTMIDMIYDKIALHFSRYPIKKKRVFIDCFEGLGYRCNCKYLAEVMKKEGYTIVWNLSRVANNDLPEDVPYCMRYSYKYFEEAYTAQIHISNDGIDPVIHKREGQYYICTWHGSGPFKKINIDLCTGNQEIEKQIKKIYQKVDLFTSASRFNTHVIRRAFGYGGEILECGSPRMDCLLNKNDFAKKVRDYYQIDSSKKIVLYAPTFRNLSIGSTDPVIESFEKYDLNLSDILKALEKKFNSSFILMYRFHHALYQYPQCNDFYMEAINVTLYPDVQELLGAADVLITDYSSIMWDFSLQKKPVFLYHNDVEEYMADRGFYSEVDAWPYIIGKTTEELYDKILGFDEDKYLEDLNNFFVKYGSFDDGHACERVVNRIMQKTRNNL